MPRLPRLSSRELIGALERVGFIVVLQRGSATCVVPQRRELRLSTLSGVLDQAGMTADELLTALG